MPNFDLSNLALKSIAPSNEILYDDLGLPSVMVKIPKMTWADLGLGTSTTTFPAFIVGGVEKDAIYISKYQNIVQNGRAYSLPGQDPKTSINFDNALKACTDKGKGWHLMTAIEWGLLINWCENNGFIPLGNNNYGKHSTETGYKAIPATKDSEHYALHTATGTGPLTWYHDQTFDGIADLCGNVWEWVAGIRTVLGEIQVLQANNAARPDLYPMTADSAFWWALNYNGSGYITNPTGTTARSIKMDWVNNKLQYTHILTDSARGQHNCAFKDINCFYESGQDDISDYAKQDLRALGLLPRENSLITSGHQVYFDNAEQERLLFRGGTYNYSAYGLASFRGNYGRAAADTNFGFRSAYVEP